MGQDSAKTRRIYFPFTAVVGADKAKLALLAVAVDPEIGGVLLVGDKGTAKTTLVRSLAQILPEIPVVKGCPYNCNPFNPREMCDVHYEMWLRGEKLEVEWRPMRVIDLPLNISVDRLVGSIDVEAALREGRVVFRPGLLAEANRNILYIDEVNLLDDHIADLILDAAATGWNVVEREGFSVRHPSRFILVGSMNPEEGELRPQLLDRFGLYVEVSASQNPEERMLIVERVEAFRNNPVEFLKTFESREAELRQKIMRARELLPRVEVPKNLLRLVAETVIKLGIKTHRAEITVVRTAKALAALDGRLTVTLEDIKKAMELALPHRLRSQPFEHPEQKMKTLQSIIQNLDSQLESMQSSPQNASQESGEGGRGEENRAGASGGGQSPAGKGFSGEGRGGGGSLRVGGVKASPYTNPLARLSDVETAPLQYKMFKRLYSFKRLYRRRIGGLGGRVGSIIGPHGYGYPVDAIPPQPGLELWDVDLYATLRTALVRGSRKPSSQDIRVRLRHGRPRLLHVILLDASGSMYAENRLAIARSILEKMAENSYVERAWSSLIVFQGKTAQTLVQPTRNPRRLLEALESIVVGGSTPLPAALAEAEKLARLFLLKNPSANIVLHMVSDGRANVPLTSSIEEDLARLSQELRRLGVKTIMYSTRSPNSLKLLDYTDLLAAILGAPVVTIPLHTLQSTGKS